MKNQSFLLNIYPIFSLENNLGNGPHIKISHPPQDHCHGPHRRQGLKGKVNIEKPCGEVSLVEPDKIENVS